jgi:hypothetical protein
MDRPSDRRARIRVLILVVVLILALGALGAGMSTRSAPGDEWDRLVALGDRLAAGLEAAPPASAGQPATARTAYLLAFHEAQDREDVARMLLVAERLARLGEATLAAHVRDATRFVARAARRAP